MGKIEKQLELADISFEVRLRVAEPEEPMIEVVAREGDDGMIHLAVPVDTQGGPRGGTLYRMDKEAFSQGGDEVLEIRPGHSGIPERPF